jgi:hypothetical protein
VIALEVAVVEPVDTDLLVEAQLQAVQAVPVEVVDLAVEVVEPAVVLVELLIAVTPVVVVVVAGEAVMAEPLASMRQVAVPATLTRHIVLCIVTRRAQIHQTVALL